MRLITCLLLLSVQLAYGQITKSQQGALNAAVDYANQSAKEVTLVTESLKRYYSSLSQGKTWSTQKYVCPVQPDAYYFSQATKLAQTEGLTHVIKTLNSLKTSADSVDKVCKDLDIYYKLEDFRKDTHAHGEELVLSVPPLLKSYRQNQRNLQSALESVFAKLNKNQNAYSKADALMRQQIVKEQNVLDSWSLNFNEIVHSGWAHELVLASILQTDQILQELQKTSLILRYPASSMWTSYQESLSSIIQEKRRAVDEYNYDAKKSDKHSNDVYLNLINYFNGTLVSNYNTFIEFSERDQYRGLKYIQYFPSFEVRTNTVEQSFSVNTFDEKQIPALSISPQQPALQRPAFNALTNYVDFINETWRQVRYLQNVLSSFNSTASYYRSLESFDKRAAMHFDFQDFVVPLSKYQKVIAESRSLPSGVTASLNAQTETLLEILKEMGNHAAFIDEQVKTKSYEKDHLDEIFNKLEREEKLFKIWDERKERLYNDVRQVFEAFPPANPKNSWYVSGSALASLVVLDHEALFLAKKFYQGDSLIKISTERIDASLRDVIAKEYDNMKGIEKLGRNNGLCPYTPYEDLPATSRRFSEKLNQLKNLQGGRNERAYESLVYDYNEIIDDYNDFCELSKEVFHLKNVLQPELFFVSYPDERKGPTKPTVKPSTIETKSNSQKSDVKKESVVIVRDTVYVHDRDTIYLTGDDDVTRSMEGFAANNLVLLLDVSGSMNAPEKLPLLKQSVLNMFDMMREEDEISIVAFSEKASVILKPSSFKDQQKIMKAIEKLKSGGKTDADAGLKIAYKVADENYIRGGNNRIILATDGEFPINTAINTLVSDWADQDIFLSIFYFGKSTKSDMLRNLARTGRGNYEQISKENAEIKLIREAKSKRKK